MNRLGISREIANADRTIINGVDQASFPTTAKVHPGLLRCAATAHRCIAGIGMKRVDKLLPVYNFWWITKTPVAQ
jgi:hypothetical protein